MSWPREALRKKWFEAGSPARLMLREIEVYGDFPANTLLLWAMVTV
jgi:hypothetical protein